MDKRLRKKKHTQKKVQKKMRKNLTYDLANKMRKFKCEQQQKLRTNLRRSNRLFKTKIDNCWLFIAYAIECERAF